jgi:ligand-binding SRPBCC domain-containing protein
MTTIQQSITIQATQEVVFLFHTNPENLAKITPPYITVGLDKWSEPGLGKRFIYPSGNGFCLLNIYTFVLWNMIFHDV